jgi:hypothetical protein
MKKNSMVRLSIILLAFTALVLPATLMAQDSKEDKIISDSKEAKAEFIKSDGLMQNLFDKSYGYVIFPKCGERSYRCGRCSR